MMQRCQFEDIWQTTYDSAVDTALDLNASAERVRRLQASIEKVIKGKGEAVELAIVTLLSRGHLLIEDVPGVGKTTLAYALARSFDCTFHRIQFTSDLLPTDLTGVTVYDQFRSQFEFRKGPIFSNVVLADELNRTTPRTQSALLEAMQEAQVTIEGDTFPLPSPFMVIATQVRYGSEGTYPLTDVQSDRFMFRVKSEYPSHYEEEQVLQKIDDLEKAIWIAISLIILLYAIQATQVIADYWLFPIILPIFLVAISFLLLAVCILKTGKPVGFVEQ